jgi:hypothetical protein
MTRDLEASKTVSTISNLISFENEPTNATRGERYFHIRNPDGYQLSFAEPITNKRKRRY